MNIKEEDVFKKYNMTMTREVIFNQFDQNNDILYYLQYMPKRHKANREDNLLPLT